MFRRRKNVPPYFRMPVPFNPVPGGHLTLSSSRPLCRFVLKGALTTSLDRADAEITHQYGPGIIHSYDNKIVVFNYETHETGVYHFHGEEGHAGIAGWDEGNNWLILGMERAEQQWYVGIVIDSAIAAGTTGRVEQTDHTWAGLGVEFNAYNPHDVELPVDLHVRWTRYPGWTEMGDPATDWVVEPWHWTECP